MKRGRPREPHLSRQRARAYVARWRAVAEADREERSGRTLAENLRTWAAFMSLARGLGLFRRRARRDEGEIGQVRAAWARLRARAHR